MSDYLSAIAARALGQATELRPSPRDVIRPGVRSRSFLAAERAIDAVPFEPREPAGTDTGGARRPSTVAQPDDDPMPVPSRRSSAARLESEGAQPDSIDRRDNDHAGPRDGPDQSTRLDRPTTDSREHQVHAPSIASVSSTPQVAAAEGQRPGPIATRPDHAPRSASKPAARRDPRSAQRAPVAPAEIVLGARPHDPYPLAAAWPSDDSAEATSVHVSIGRVEVRAIAPSVPAAPPPSPMTPRLSLDDYLRHRDAGAEA